MGDLAIIPVSPDRWDDVLELFGESGAYSNCWCTWWLLTASAWDEASPTERCELLAGKIRSGDEPGLLAYRDGEPVGWCAVGPRSWYGRLNSTHSQVFRRHDDSDTWVINCFFIHKLHRGTGVATALLAAAVDHAIDRGAQIVEGYPIDRAVHSGGSARLFVGTLSMFRDAGFEEVARMNDRPLVRLRPA